MRINSNYIIIAVVVLLLIVLNALGMNFPMPWEDESDFVFQSIAFANDNTLFTNTLSDNRIIMWMQPGYMIFLGLIFKLFGYSFELARAVSWMLYIGAYIILALLVKKHLNIAGLIALSLTFLLPAGLAVANVARMESSILFLSSVSLYFLMQKRFISSFAIIILGVLFHFNMLYFMIALAGIFIYDFKYANDKKISQIALFSKFDFILLAISLSLLLMYLIFVYFNIDSYIHDMTYQFGRKFHRVPFYYSYKKLSITVFISLLSVYMFFKHQRTHLLFSLYALCAVLVVMIGQEGWYLIFEYIGIALVFGVLFDYFKNIYFRVIMSVVFVFYIYGNFTGGFANMKPVFYATPYIDDKTVKSIENIILDYKSSHKIDNMTISFERKGVDLLFVKFAKKHNIQIIHELPEKVEHFRKVDIIIYITRASDPGWLKDIHYLRPDRADLIIVSNKNSDIKIIKGK